MPRYGHTKRADGTTRMRILSEGEYDQKEVATPSSPDLPGGPEASYEERIICLVDGCGRTFLKSMHAARHFNSDHTELSESSDSWRDYTQKITVDLSDKE